MVVAKASEHKNKNTLSSHYCKNTCVGFRFQAPSRTTNRGLHLRVTPTTDTSQTWLETDQVMGITASAVPL